MPTTAESDGRPLDPVQRPTPPRRRPKQQRSQANYDAILAAAESILIDDGLDGLTTTHIADRAGVAVGTVYQYFTDVGSIVDELWQRCADDFAESLSPALASVRITRKRDAANAALDAFVDFYRSSRLLQALRAAGSGDALMASGTGILEVVTDALVGAGLGDASDGQFVRDLEVQWAVAQALIPLAFRTDPDGDPAVLDHLRMLFGLDLGSMPPARPRVSGT